LTAGVAIGPASIGSTEGAASDRELGCKLDRRLDRRRGFDRRFDHGLDRWL